ncbi:MAG TPA: hypothetical protein VK550_15920 [Polyangiaceae bacterium]|nr:hypothetical protein [Polyangiaceae bacterium]
MAAILSVALTRAPAAYAQAQPRAVTGTYSPYELASIEEAVAALGTRVAPDPEGKTVEGIDIVTLDVVEPRDPAPRALNMLHATSRRAVIAREILLTEGEPYSAFRCDETARNLRLLHQLSLVICTATYGSAADQVRVLVITKDVWSLRLGWDISFTGGGLDSLQLVPTETNFGGTHQIVLARYLYQPESQSLGFGYQIPRLAGRRLSLTADAGLIWNRKGDTEGSSGSISVAKTLYSARTEWAWAMGANWRDEVVRRYQNGRLAVDAAGVPWQYGARRVAEAAYVTRSFGLTYKHDFTLGAEMNIRSFRAHELPDFDAVAVAAFARANLPRSDTRVGPFLQYRAYTSKFLRVLDFETLGLQEDFRLGHDAYLRVYPIAEQLGSSRTFLGTYAAMQYTVELGDGLVRASVESSTEAEAHRLSDAWFEVDLRIVTPRLGFGRLVFDAGALNRYRNYLNRQSYLGGDSRLRGYPSTFFVGKDVIVYNLEFRSRPLQILSCQLGAAAFYDVGHVANGFSRLHPRQAVGVGFRVLFPQLDRVVFRGDVGFPLARPLDAGVPPFTVSIAFEQAFSVPSIGGRTSTSLPTGWLGQ